MFNLSKKDAAERFRSLEISGIESFSPDDNYSELHTTLLRKYNDIKKIEGTNLYEKDLRFAIYLFENLNRNLDFSERDASSDDNWRYISLNILADIVYDRWGSFHEGRFYNDSRRIWLKTLWWYIFLSWQGTSSATFEILRNNTTDDLVQMVERPGNKGYRVDLSRALMKHYSLIEGTSRNKLFRKVMKLNTARVKVIEPSLVPGGNEQYAKELFEYFD
ncbi:hypothetical protein ACTL32_05270 [Planococcus sp. FY231025]|uniref:hypothetical protein n=1 Tax=Planococcus sp. FY231025 TaxID=3455699 RepID=UPI003F8DB8CB